MKSNPSKYNPAKQDFIAYEISSVEDGFDCVILRLEYHANPYSFFYTEIFLTLFLIFRTSRTMRMLSRKKWMVEGR